MRWLVALAACCGCTQALALGCAATSARGAPRRAVQARRWHAPCMQAGSNQEETIAELEARLEALKRAEAEAEAAEVATVASPGAPPESIEGTLTEVAGGFDLTTMSNRKKVASVQGPAPEELLSEAWKESEDGDGAGFPLVQAAGAIALAIGLVAFSQVPIGQDTTDLSSFGGRAPTLETPMQIKARYETLGIYEEGSE